MTLDKNLKYLSGPVIIYYQTLKLKTMINQTCKNSEVLCVDGQVSSFVEPFTFSK